MSETPLIKEKMNSVSVVIPTLGGESLRDTIEHLNSGTIVPAEILVCIPDEDAFRVEGLPFPNMRVIKTHCRGQVAQRAIGFQNVENDLVLQLDDDIIVDKECISILFELMHKLPCNAAIAPSLFNSDTRKPFYIKPENSFFLNIYYMILNGKDGYQPGTITKAGTNIGFDPSTISGDYFASEWLLGGCVLHLKKNLILNDFYPFKGKAYCEDLYHSELLKRKGIELIYSTKTVIWARIEEGVSFTELLKQCIADFRVRSRFIKMYPEGRSLLRMYCFYAINYTRHFLNMLRSIK